MSLPSTTIFWSLQMILVRQENQAMCAWSNGDWYPFEGDLSSFEQVAEVEAANLLVLFAHERFEAAKALLYKPSKIEDPGSTLSLRSPNRHQVFSERALAPYHPQRR